MEDFHSMGRRQLQALCKQHHIPANSTNSQMADRLAALFASKVYEDPKPPGPSCLKSSGSGGGDADGVRTRSKRKMVSFLLPQGSHKPERESSGSSRLVREDSPVPTRRSRALRSQRNAGSAILYFDVRSTGIGKREKALSNTNSGEQDYGGCPVDEGIVAGARSLRSRVVTAGADGGGTTRSLKRRDPGVAEDVRVITAAADGLPVPIVPENGEVTRRRGPKRRHREPAIDVVSYPTRSTLAAGNLAQAESERGCPRQSKRNLQKGKSAVPGRKMEMASESKEVALDIPDAASETRIINEVAVESVMEERKITQRPRRSLRNLEKLGDEGLQDNEHGGAFKNRVQRQTRSKASEETGPETSTPVGVRADCNGAPEIQKKSQFVTQDEGPLRRSRRNASKDNKLVNDVLLTATGKSEDDAGNVAGAILGRKPKIQRMKSGAVSDRKSEHITGNVQVQENNMVASDFVEPSNQKRRKSTICDVTEEEVSLPPLGETGDDKNHMKDEHCGKTKSWRFDQKFVETFPFGDEADSEIMVLGDVKEHVELLQCEGHPVESKDEGSKGTSSLAKQEKVMDVTFEKNGSVMRPTQLYLEADVSLKKSKIGGEHCKRRFQCEENSPKKDRKESEFQYFREDCNVGCIGSPAVTGESIDSIKSHDLDDGSQAGSLMVPPSIIHENVEHSLTNGKGSVRKSSNKKAASSLRRSGRKKIAHGYQCCEESDSPNEKPNCDEPMEHATDNTDAQTPTGFAEILGTVENLQTTKGEDGTVARGTNTLLVEDESEMSHSFSAPKLTLKNDTVVLMDDGLSTIGVSSTNEAKNCDVVVDIMGKDQGQMHCMSITDIGKVVGPSIVLGHQLPIDVSDEKADSKSTIKCKVNKDDASALIMGRESGEQRMQERGKSEGLSQSQLEEDGFASISLASKIVNRGDETVLGNKPVVNAFDVSIFCPEGSPVGYSARERLLDMVEHPGRISVSGNVSKGFSSPPIHGLLSVYRADNQEGYPTVEIPSMGDDMMLSPLDSREDVRFADATQSASNSLSSFCTHSRPDVLTANDKGSELHEGSVSGLWTQSRNKKLPGETEATTLFRTQSFDKKFMTPGSEKEFKTTISHQMQGSTFCTGSQLHVLTADDQGSELHEQSSSLLTKSSTEKVLGEAVATTLPRAQFSEKECISPCSVGFSHGDHRVESTEADDPTHAISNMSTMDQELTCEDAVKENSEVHILESNSIAQVLTSSSDSEKSIDFLEMTVGRQTSYPSSDLRISSKCDIALSEQVASSLSACQSVSKASNITDGRRLVGHGEGDVYTLGQSPVPNNETELVAEFKTVAKSEGSMFTNTEDNFALTEIHENLTAEKSAIKFSGMLQYTVEKKLSLIGHEKTTVVIADIPNEAILVNEPVETRENMEVEGAVGSNRLCKSGLSIHIKAVEARADVFDSVTSGNKVAELIETAEWLENEVASNSEVNLVGHRDTAMPSIGNLDKQIELGNEELLMTEGADGGNPVATPMKVLESNGSCGLTMPLHATACENVIGLVKKHEAGSSAELLDVAIGSQRDEELSSYKGIINPVFPIVLPDASVTCPSIDQPACEEHSFTNNRCLVDLNNVCVNVVARHGLLDNSSKKFVEARIGPTDLEMNISIDRARKYVLHETAERLQNHIEDHKECPHNRAYDSTNVKEAVFLDSNETAEQPCKVVLDKPRETMELVIYTLDGEEKLLGEVSEGRETVSAKGETRYWSTLDTEEGKETTCAQLDNIHVLSPLETPILKDSTETDSEGLGGIDKPLEGYDSNDQPATRTDGSCFQDTKLNEQSVMSSIGPSDGGSVNLYVKVPESSFVEITSDVNSREILESFILRTLYPDSSRIKSCFRAKDDPAEPSLCCETCLECLQTENSIGGYDWMDYSEIKKKDDEPNIVASEQELRLEVKNLKEKGDNVPGRLKAGAPRLSGTVIVEVKELKGGEWEKTPTCKHKIVVNDAENAIGENGCKDLEEFEEEENRADSGPPEEKLNHEAEHRCHQEHNDETLGGKDDVCFESETMGNKNESLTGEFDESFEHETKRDAEGEDGVVIFAEQFDDSRLKEASSNKQGLNPDHDYLAYIEDPTFQSLVQDIQSAVTDKTDIEVNIDQDRGSWGSQNATRDTPTEEAGRAQAENFEMKTETDLIQEQTEDLNYLFGFYNTHCQAPKQEPTCMEEHEASESLYSFEGNTSEKSLDLEAIECAESWNGEEGRIDSCQDAVGGQAGAEEISGIVSDTQISSAHKQMVTKRISCTPKRNQSLKGLLGAEKMKENTPHSKMVHANNVVKKSTVPTSKRRALADLQNKIQ